MKEAVYGILMALILFMAAYGISNIGDYRIYRIIYSDSENADNDQKKKFRSARTALKLMCFIYVAAVLIFNVMDADYNLKILASGIAMLLIMVPLWQMSFIKTDIAEDNEMPEVIIKERIIRVIYVVLCAAFLVAVISGIGK